MRRLILTVIWLIIFSGQSNSLAQSHFDQDLLSEIIKNQSSNLDEIPEVFYEYHVLGDSTGNSVLARNRLYLTLGENNSADGFKRAKLVELINRKMLRDIELGDTLVIPTEFDLDFRAYSPFPRHYSNGRDFSKLLILNRASQAFGAYEYGKLVRWGPINTGTSSSPTPTGRFNMNWREEHRISSLSPPGEPWHMYWVVNVHAERGIHMHQYAMPTGGPASHGCIRMLNDDAKWVYHWGEMGDEIDGPLGSTVLIIGDQPNGAPEIFEFKRNYPVLKTIDLPDDPANVSPGTWLQRKYGVKK